jgi:DNA-binding transcriptional MerR regulator
VTLMTIGEFGVRTRLSPKALRLYDGLGLVVPAQVDPSSGYRLYAEEQIEMAQLVGLLRRLDMPLVTIADVVAMDPVTAVGAVSDYWAQVEDEVSERRALVAHLRSRLMGEQLIMYDIETRTMPERRLLTMSRHVHAETIDAFFDEAFATLRNAAPGIEGVAGVPFLVFYGEVSDDSDGPVELCRPVVFDTDLWETDRLPELQLRLEPAHDEAYIRLAHKDLGWPALLPAVDALGRWVDDHDRQPTGAFRQLLIGDQRTAGPDDPVVDLTLPLR